MGQTEDKTYNFFDLQKQLSWVHKLEFIVGELCGLILASWRKKLKHLFLDFRTHLSNLLQFVV